MLRKQVERGVKTQKGIVIVVVIIILFGLRQLEGLVLIVVKQLCFSLELHSQIGRASCRERV